MAKILSPFQTLFKRGLVLSAAALSTTACASVDVKTLPSAVLTNPSDLTHVEITQAVKTALSRPSVLIAKDALTKSDRLIIELSMSGGIDTPGLGGRRMDKPDHFYLKTDGVKCYLLHDQSGQSFELSTATCRSVSKD